MKIALFGYGKMGKAIEKIALKRGHTIVARIDMGMLDADFSMADVAIDFSVPGEAFNNINKCFNKNIPIVCGTTGWLDKFDEAKQLCKEKNGAFIYASNFSLGVNLFFELNRQLATMMNRFKEYKVHIEETHHTQKLDAPSGTAITLAEGIIDSSDLKAWKLGVTESPDEIPITSKRIDNVPGIHTITYASEVDEIEIMHSAKSREGFALGAVIAAEWLKGKTGIFTMKDVLGI